MTPENTAKAALAVAIAALAGFLTGASSDAGDRFEIQIGQSTARSGHFVFRLDRASGEVCSWRQASLGVGPEVLSFLGCSNKEHRDG